MFYVNNEQVKGIYLNDISLNYLAYGFGKIIPEDRNAEQLNLNLAYKYLNHYRIEYGTVKDGYENALVSPRIDEPDPRGVFCTPFTYYYSGNIVSTKNVPVLITDGNCALSNALVYNDMNINGAINHFASNTDFQGHNINVSPEKECFGPLLNYEMLNNCSNFDLNISTRFSKATYPTLYNCNNFSGNYRYVGNQDIEYSGFRYFLRRCRDGIFNIDCTNMHGGGIFNIDDINMSSGGNVRKYFNFIGIQSCENMNVNITGSSWQVWPHDHSFTSNCNINTYNVISGFSYMNYCNFNVVLPKDSNPEMSQSFEFLNNAENCNYNLNALDSNLFNYRSGVGYNVFFDRLNNCNLNLLVNNTVSFDHSFGGNLNNCNIKFDNIKADLSAHAGWLRLYNCNITGNVEASSRVREFIGQGYGLNVNINAAKSSNILALWDCNNVKGNLVAGATTYINYSNYLNLNVSKGSLSLINVEHSRFDLSRTNASVDNLNNCYFIGFPYSFVNMNNCIFDVGLEEAIHKNASYITWNNVWAHGFRMSDGSYRYLAGLKSISPYIYNCSITSDDMVLGGNRMFINVNNMQTPIDTYYNGTVIANLPIYNMNIKFNVDCHNLNLGVFQAGPPHGLEYSSISADNIFCSTGNNYYVYMNYGTRIYCENFCNVAFSSVGHKFSDNYQPVLLINNYLHSNTGACTFKGGIYRIGRLNYRGYMSVPMKLYNGACMFINSADLSDTIVDNSLLFLGTNVYLAGDITVTNGGMVVNKANYSMSAISKFVNRNNFAWNFTDSGPWGSMSLFDYCINV